MLIRICGMTQKLTLPFTSYVTLSTLLIFWLSFLISKMII